MKWTFCIALIVMFASCTHSGKQQPVVKVDNLIPKDQMVELMTDIMVLEAHIQKKYESVNRNYLVMTASVKEYLNSKGVSEQQYKDSYTYYFQDRNELLKILEKVEEELLKESYQSNDTIH